jgi:hypothetical protein
MSGRRCQPLRSGPLDPAERAQLERLHAQHPRTLGGRAEAILLSSQRVSVPEIMRRLRVSRPTVSSWITRFEQSGVAGLSRKTLGASAEAHIRTTSPRHDALRRTRGALVSDPRVPPAIDPPERSRARNAG